MKCEAERKSALLDPARGPGISGLTERRQTQDQETLPSYTAIVTDANALVQDIHDRMPVILPPTDYGAWLDQENKHTDAPSAMLKPIDPGRWTMHPVSRRVNSPRNDGPELIDCVDDESP